MTKKKHDIKVTSVSDEQGAVLGTVNGQAFKMQFDHSQRGYRLQFNSTTPQPDRTAVGMWARREAMKRKASVAA